MQMNSQNKGQKGMAKTGDKRKSSQAQGDDEVVVPKSGLGQKRQKIVQEDELKASYHSEDDDDMDDIPIN